MSAHAGSRWLGRRYLFRIGHWGIPSYAALLYVGVVAGIFAGAAAGRGAGLPADRFALAVVVLLVPALVGARLWYVVQHLDRYRAEPRRLWRREEGGLALFGGLALALAVSAPVLALAGLPFAAFWDAASVTMLVGLIFTRFGCLMNGCCVGRATGGPLGVWLPDHTGQWLRRYPTQLLEAAWASVMLVVLWGLRAVLPVPGALVAVSLVAYVAVRLLLEPLRATPHAGRSRWLHLGLYALLLAGAGAIVLLGGLR